MGAYLSKPVTDKISTDESNKVLTYGASSMQGWRVYQEDAHNTILDFEKDSSLFAVYDGHGGHEVATYTAAELPNVIKNTGAFGKEQYTEALIDAFMEFDATLVQPEVLAILKDLAGTKDQDDSDYDGEEVDHLCREAAMPLEEVMAKYCEDNQFPNSETEREEHCCSNPEEATSSTKGGQEDPLSAMLKTKQDEPVASVIDEKPSLSSARDAPGQSELGLSGGLVNGETDEKLDSADSSEAVNGEVEEGVKDKAEEEEKAQVNGKIKDEGGGTKDSSRDPELESSLTSTKEDEKDDMNGDVNATSTSSPAKGKGKGKAKGKSILSAAMVHAVKVIRQKDSKRKAAEMAERIYRQIQCTKDDDETDEDEEDEDDNFEGTKNSLALDDTSSSEDDDEEDSDLENDDDECPSDAEEDEEGSEDPYNGYHEFSMNMREEPGYDSGCTACIALLHGRDLFVANVGDSRCVVCRDGKAFDMSIDHKPEDEPEAARITKAGGRITSDGRVNGGLNLSRALGDHSYKQNKSQGAADQMISPLPDVRSLKLSPKDTFMVIACDGIWNSMTSQEVCDFTAERIQAYKKLSTIAEELFDRCLSPNAQGDGTGCDNMTCIIVKLHDLLFDEGGKRPCEEIDDSGGSPTQDSQQKKSRLEVVQ